MNNASDKKDLISYIIQRTKNITKDSNTFLFMRCEHYEELAARPDTLGGGNFLMALGLFSTLVYLAKIYDLLSGGDCVVSSRFAEESKTFYAGLSAEERKLVSPKIEGSANEEIAFCRLIKDSKQAHNIGLVLQQLGPTYKGIRNMLAHMVATKIGNRIMTFGSLNSVPFEDYRQRVVFQDNSPVFNQGSDGTLECNVDYLSRDVDRIAEWLAGRVEEDDFGSLNMQAAIHWIREILE